MEREFEDISLIKENRDYIIRKLKRMETNLKEEEKNDLKKYISSIIEEINNLKKKLSSQTQMLKTISEQIEGELPSVDEYLGKLNLIEGDLSNIFNFENSPEGEAPEVNDAMDEMYSLILKQANKMEQIKQKKDKVISKLCELKSENINDNKVIIKSNLSKFSNEILLLKDNVDDHLNSLVNINNNIQEKFPIIDSQIKELYEVKESITGLFYDLDEYDNNLDDYFTKAILDDIYQLKTNITNILEIQINKGKELTEYSKFSKYKKIDAAILGGFSVGKTTLIKRLLGDSAGGIDASPQTGAPIKHYQSDIRTLSIYFTKNILSNNKANEQLQMFIGKYDLTKKFTLTKEGWQFNGKTEVSFDNIPTSKILSIVNELDSFHEIVEKVEWGHKENNLILNNLNVFDLPGFEGNEKHENKILSYFDKYTPEMLIYLVDPDRGVPSEKEFESLVKVINLLISKEVRFNFFWCYQKETYSNMSKRNKFKKEMKDLILNTLEEVNFNCLKYLEIKEILKTAPILDARGNKENRKKAQLSIISGIGKVLISKSKELIVALEEEEITFQKKLGPVSGMYDYKMEIRESINILLQKEGLITYEDTKVTLVDLLKLREIEELMNLLPKDSDSLPLIKMSKEKIKEIKGKSLNLIKLFHKENKMFNIFSSKKLYEDFNFDYHYIKNDFFRELEGDRNEDIKNLINCMYETHLLILFFKVHSKVLLTEHYRDIENKIINQIKKDIKKLNKKLFL